MDPDLTILEKSKLLVDFPDEIDFQKHLHNLEKMVFNQIQKYYFIQIKKKQRKILRLRKQLKGLQIIFRKYLSLHINSRVVKSSFRELSKSRLQRAIAKSVDNLEKKLIKQKSRERNPISTEYLYQKYFLIKIIRVSLVISIIRAFDCAKDWDRVHRNLGCLLIQQRRELVKFFIELDENKWLKKVFKEFSKHSSKTSPDIQRLFKVLSSHTNTGLEKRKELSVLESECKKTGTFIVIYASAYRKTQWRCQNCGTIHEVEEQPENCKNVKCGRDSSYLKKDLANTDDFQMTAKLAMKQEGATLRHASTAVGFFGPLAEEKKLKKFRRIVVVSHGGPGIVYFNDDREVEHRSLGRSELEFFAKTIETKIRPKIQEYTTIDICACNVGISETFLQDIADRFQCEVRAFHEILVWCSKGESGKEVPTGLMVPYSKKPETLDNCRSEKWRTLKDLFSVYHDNLVIKKPRKK